MFYAHYTKCLFVSLALGCSLHWPPSDPVLCIPSSHANGLKTKLNRHDLRSAASNSGVTPACARLSVEPGLGEAPSKELLLTLWKWNNINVLWRTGTVTKQKRGKKKKARVRRLDR